MDPTLLLPLVEDSDTLVVLAFLVFLALTNPRQRGNKRSGRPVGTGRHRNLDAQGAAEREPTVSEPEGPD